MQADRSRERLPDIGMIHLLPCGKVCGAVLRVAQPLRLCFVYELSMVWHVTKEFLCSVTLAYWLVRWIDIGISISIADKLFSCLSLSY